MTQSLTDWLQQSRLIVVDVDPRQRRLRVKSEAPACTELSCGRETVIVTDDGASDDLSALNVGDIIKVDAVGDRARKIVVVRRVWEELTSPEF
ncbi:MAG: hypothetical protein HY216_01830 [Candidatus Rokubacteria bacterium]|nr:hypothetical protein [Candidatus Rokubacteria bacterium]